MIRYCNIVVLVALSTQLIACGNKPIETTVTSIAIYGARVSEILVSAQELVAKGTPTPIPEAAAAKAMVGFKEASAIGLKLADALKLFDLISAADEPKRLVAVSDIERLMIELRRATRVVLVFTGDNAVGQQLLKLYDNLDAVLREIQFGLDKWKLSTVAAVQPFTLPLAA